MIPAHIQSLLELRHGYANYHFNRLETQRVWNALRQQTAVDDRRGSWTLEGELAGGGSLRVVLDDRQGFAQWTSPQDRNEWVANLEQDLAEQMQPTGSGGFYVALHLWRRLLVLGPSKFGEVTYWGTAPWQDRQTLCDVYVAIHDALETRFYFDPTSGLLVGLEMFRDSDQDPCEVSFGGYQAIDGQQLPQQIAVRFGDLLFAEWKLTSITLDRAVEEIK